MLQRHSCDLETIGGWALLHFPRYQTCDLWYLRMSFELAQHAAGNAGELVQEKRVVILQELG